MPRILLVEDDPLWMRVLERRLINAGHVVICAANGRAALRRLALSAVLPDLVLTDLCMPEATGYDLCAALRADPRGATLPIVVMSSLDAPEYREYLAGYHVARYLIKPVTAGDILAAIAAVLPGNPPALSAMSRSQGAA
jgi:CheY-like chemotaxis protein